MAKYLTLKPVVFGPTDQQKDCQTNIIMYITAIAAKKKENMTILGGCPPTIPRRDL